MVCTIDIRVPFDSLLQHNVPWLRFADDAASADASAAFAAFVSRTQR